MIIKVDADNEKLSNQQGRDKVLKDYIDNNEVGKPWVIPAEQMDVVQVKPLSLADLAINDAVQIDKKAVAAIVQVPPYMVGAGDYDKDEYNQWIQGPVMALCKSIAEELTRKLILSPKWYLRMNVSPGGFSCGFCSCVFLLVFSARRWYSMGEGGFPPP